MNLNSGYHVGIPSVNYGNRQFFDKDNFASGKQANFESSNEVLVNNPRPPCFQQEEPSLFHESYKVESSKLLNLDQVGLVSQSDKSILKSEYDRELLSTYFYAKNKELGGLDIPFVLETSSCKETYVNLTSNAYVNNEYETMHLGKQNLLTSECEIHAVVKSGLSVNASISDERVTKIGDGLSPNMHEQSKPITGGLNPAISEKIWDGSLKLNTSTTVSTVAFFKSGEKLQDLNWPDHVEIKGKVRLQAFEKFIQELPRSRNRALMSEPSCMWCTIDFVRLLTHLELEIPIKNSRFMSRATGCNFSTATGGNPQETCIFFSAALMNPFKVSCLYANGTTDQSIFNNNICNSGSKNDSIFRST